MIRQNEHVNHNGSDASTGPVHKVHNAFRIMAHKTASAVGSPWAFTLAILAVIVWAILGPMYHYSDTWQLVINTATTIITFLMVFLIQNTQNRDARAFHLKLDELIRGMKGARNYLVDLENCTDEELDQIEKEFQRIRNRASHGHAHHEHQGAPATAQHHVQPLGDHPSRSGSESERASIANRDSKI
jgi:low affinity Fe/Cu permease